MIELIFIYTKAVVDSVYFTKTEAVEVLNAVFIFVKIKYKQQR